MNVARIPPAMLMMYLINSSREPNVPGSIFSSPVAVPSVAAEPKTKLSTECIIVKGFWFITKILLKSALSACFQENTMLYAALFRTYPNIAVWEVHPAVN